MIKKVNEAWKRLLSNDYAYFLIFPLLFAIISIPVSTLFLRLGWFEQTDVNTFSTQWVMGFLFALYLHWRRKSKAQSHIEQVLQRALQKCEALFLRKKLVDWKSCCNFATQTREIACMSPVRAQVEMKFLPLQIIQGIYGESHFSTSLARGSTKYAIERQ